MEDDQDILATRVRANSFGVAEQAVVARLPSEQEQVVNLRFVRGTAFADPRPLRCRPRGNVQQTGFDFVRDAVAVLPGNLLARLKDANERVIGWIAASETNARLFTENPARALKEARVELSRSDEKAIARAREELSDEAALPPGTRLTGISAKGYARGEVGKIATVPAREPAAKKRGCVRE